SERSIVVPAGSQGRIDVPLNAARLLLSAAGTDSSALADTVVFSVVEDDPDAPKGRREVVRSATRQADFVVPPGTYYVVARQGSVEVRERLAVGPGDVMRRTLNLAAGRRALATKPSGGPQAASARRRGGGAGGRVLGYQGRGRGDSVDHGAVGALRDSAGGPLSGARGDA